MINWNCSRYDTTLIREIVRRAAVESATLPSKEWIRNAEMDITAVHCNGVPLRLDEWRKADSFNFWHDFSGIANCIDRTTGELTNHFLPRFYRSPAFTEGRA